MTVQNNSVDQFIGFVEKMRQAQRDYFETKSTKAYHELVVLEKMVDAWIVAWRLDEENLAAWTG